MPTTTVVPMTSTSTTYRLAPEDQLVVYVSSGLFGVLCGLLLAAIIFSAQLQHGPSIRLDILFLIGLALIATLYMIWSAYRWTTDTWLTVSIHGLTFHTY